MDPLYVGAVATFAGIVVTTIGNIVLGRINATKEKTKSSEDAAKETAKEVAQSRLDFKDEQIDFWR